MKGFSRTLRNWGGLMVLMLALAATCATAAEREMEPEVEPPTRGMLEAETPDGEKVPCPLKHTSVRADISGYLANVEVRQHFQNPLDEKIEAVYTFPLPENSAVHEMIMVVGRRDIYGEIHERERARYIYEQARAAGKRTALLEQERPNIFTQSVANIQRHEEIIIVIRYVQPLKYDNGTYNYHFPMVVGPRFIPGSPTDRGKKGTGWAPDTDTVPDASRITPPVLKPGYRTGHDISVEVYLDAGMAIEDLHCRSHDAGIHKLDGTAHYIKLKDADSIPNKDFMLSYRVAGEKPRSALLTHKSQGGGYFMLMFQPSLQNVTTEYHPREMYFVLDCSGSMRGEPMAKSKQAMVSCIRGIGPKDTFQIIRFSSKASQFSEKPVPSTQENKRKALEYVDGLHGSGGTMMIEGIKAALGGNRDPERRRVVFFFTDGYIGNENQIFDAIKEKVGNARIYSFGVGSSVNRHLIEGMAKLGGGVAHVVRQDEDPSQVITGLYSRLEKPYLKDIHLDVDGVQISDIYPDPIPNLLQAQPLLVFGRYEGSGWSTVTVSGELRGEYYRESLNVSFPQWNSDNVSLPSAWARQKIQQMMFEQLGRPKDLSGKITDLALEYHLMSQYTSFVAVDEQIPPGSDSTLPRTVAVPVPMPEGVSFHGVFGSPGRYPGRAVRSVGEGVVAMDAAKPAEGARKSERKMQLFRAYPAPSGGRMGGMGGAGYQYGGYGGVSAGETRESWSGSAGYAAGYGGGGYGGGYATNKSRARGFRKMMEFRARTPGTPAAESEMQAGVSMGEAMSSEELQEFATDDEKLYREFSSVYYNPGSAERANEALRKLLTSGEEGALTAAVALCERMAMAEFDLDEANIRTVDTMLDTNQPAERSAALQMKVLMADKLDEALLRRAARDSDPHTRMLIALKLSRTVEPSRAKWILKLLDDDHPSVKALAARAARKAEDPTPFVDRLAAIVTGADPEKYAGAVLEAAIGLARATEKEPVRTKAQAALLQALRREFPEQFAPYVRIAALKGLEGYDADDGLPVFRSLMKQAEHPDVRALACQRALAYPEAVPEIRETVFTDQAFVSRPELLASVVQSARKVEKGKDLANWAQEALQSGNYGAREHGLLRVALVECMLDDPTPKRVKYATSLLRTDRSWRVRRAVLARLASRGGMPLHLAADLALEDPHPLVKRLATAAMVALKAEGKEHRQYLKQLSQQPTLATCESVFSAENVSPDLALKRADAIRESLKG